MIWFMNSSLEPSKLPESSLVDVSQLEIRAMLASDASQFVACLTRCYGDSYPNPLMYQPESIASAIQQGEMHSVVAVTPQGEVVGHSAFSFDHPHDLIPENGKLFVDPRYRGHHISDLLSQKRKIIATNLSLPGYWSACVTNHPFSQHEVIALGGAEIGLLINGQPSSVHMEGLHNLDHYRHSILPFYTSLVEKDSGPVYLPKYHRPFFEDLLRHTGIQREIISVGQRPQFGAQVIARQSKEGKPTGIRVLQMGVDLLKQVEIALGTLQGKNHPVVYIDLPLSDPAVISQIPELEAFGFIWGAWLPHFLSGGDILRLQKLNDTNVSDQEIMCARPEGILVRDYVLSEWRRIYSPQSKPAID